MRQRESQNPPPVKREGAGVPVFPLVSFTGTLFFSRAARLHGQVVRGPESVKPPEHLLKSPGQNKHMSSNDRVPFKPTGGNNNNKYS